MAKYTEPSETIVSETQPATLHAIDVAIRKKQRSRDTLIKNYGAELTAINGEINELLASKKSLLERELANVEGQRT